MKRVIGIGGLFFKTEDPEKTRAWYNKHLGFNTNEWGCTFFKKDDSENASIQWSPFAKDTTYFEPSQKDYMFNYRVVNLEDLLEVLKEEGVTVVGKIEEYEYGKFGWVLDCDGNKIELWEPKDEAFL